MPKTILITDDDLLLTKMYRLNLATEDIHVETAKNGQEAMDFMDKHQPDLLLLDLLMPKIDGYAVLEHIRKKKYHFPVIVLSNLSQDIDQQKCLELGARDYFIKSDMDMPVLLEKVQAILAEK